MNLDTSRILGSKTGFTLEAGSCISALFNSDDHEYLMVLLNAERTDNKSYNIIDTLDLIKFIDDNYNNIAIVQKDSVVKTINIKYSSKDTYDIKASEDVTLYLPIDYNKDLIKIEYDGLDTISSKNKIDDIIGTVKYYYDNNLVKEEEIHLQEKIDFNLLTFIKVNIIQIVITILIIIVIFIIFGKLSKKKKLERK